MQTPKGQSLIQFIKFALVGASNTLISEGFYFLFVFFGGNYILGNFLGFSLSVINAYLWSNAFVFKKKQGEQRIWWKVLGKTYLAYLSVYIINAVLLIFWVDVVCLENYLGGLEEWFFTIGWSKFDTKLLGELCGAGINMILTVPLNFLVNKFWAYRSSRKEITQKKRN